MLMKLQINNELDFLYRERIETLLNQGYYGYKIDNITIDDRGEIIVAKALNKKGDIVKSKGQTLVDACQQMISLIDTTFDDY